LLGRRRTTIAEAAPTREFSMDAMIEKAPVTVILSAKGWVAGPAGHVALDGDFKFKEGDGPAFALHARPPTSC
jgi:topoisomerase-4 subunit A